MITLEQIRLLESKITRALDLIRVLKEENSTLRKGLESAQRRMRELETLVDGFKTDQKEIESVIVRTLHNLDELEESAATAATPATAGGIPAGGIQAVSAKRAEARTGAGTVPSAAASPAAAATTTDADAPAPKEELDIF
jgi:FtsZ-binding cell division protein ZapB